MPGDIFVLRNAGNTCTHSEGSMVGSLEFCTGALGSRLIVVLGHTKCGAINGATKAFFDGKTAPPAATSSALQGLLQDLGSVAEQAAHDMGPHAEQDAVAAHAVKVNVFHTIDFLLKFSESIREKVKSGQAGEEKLKRCLEGIPLAKAVGLATSAYVCLFSCVFAFGKIDLALEGRRSITS